MVTFRRNVFAYLLVFTILFPASVQRLPAKSWPASKTASAYSQDTVVPYQVLGGTHLNRTTCIGGGTVLECIQTLANIPRHDQDMGRTQLLLRTHDGGKVLLNETFNEIWRCLGFNPRTRRYLIVSENEHGVKVTLRGLVYLDESRAAFKESVFGEKLFEAVASLTSPGGTYLVLIGSPEGDEGAGLYVLNTDTDQLRLIGTPPAPPPLSREELEYPHAVDMMGAWEAPERHYTELEPGIWTFTGPDILHVSYGNDSVKARGAKRTIKQWDLKSVFGK